MASPQGKLTTFSTPQHWLRLRNFSPIVSGFYDDVTFVSFYWKFLMKNGLDSEHESIYYNTFPPILYKFYVAHTYVTRHEKTGIMYTKYISSYYGTYLLYCINISKSSGKLD